MPKENLEITESPPAAPLQKEADTTAAASLEMAREIPTPEVTANIHGRRERHRQRDISET
jgi:hypothetical protein